MEVKGEIETGEANEGSDRKQQRLEEMKRESG